MGSLLSESNQSEHHTVLLCDISKLWHLYHYTIYQSNKIHLFFTFDDDVIFWDEGCQAERAPCSRYVFKSYFFSFDWSKECPMIISHLLIFKSDISCSADSEEKSNQEHRRVVAGRVVTIKT